MRIKASIGAGLAAGMLWLLLGSLVNVAFFYVARWRNDPAWSLAITRDFIGSGVGAYLAMKAIAHFSGRLSRRVVFWAFTFVNAWVTCIALERTEGQALWTASTTALTALGVSYVMSLRLWPKESPVAATPPASIDPEPSPLPKPAEQVVARAEALDVDLDAHQRRLVDPEPLVGDEEQLSADAYAIAVTFVNEQLEMLGMKDPNTWHGAREFIFGYTMGATRGVAHFLGLNDKWEFPGLPAIVAVADRATSLPDIVDEVLGYLKAPQGPYVRALAIGFADGRSLEHDRKFGLAEAIDPVGARAPSRH